MKLFISVPLSSTNAKFYSRSTAEPGYNDIGLCDTSFIASDILQ